MSGSQGPRNALDLPSSPSNAPLHLGRVDGAVVGRELGQLLILLNHPDRGVPARRDVELVPYEERARASRSVTRVLGLITLLLRLEVLLDSLKPLVRLRPKPRLDNVPRLQNRRLRVAPNLDISSQNLVEVGVAVDGTLVAAVAVEDAEEGATDRLVALSRLGDHGIKVGYIPPTVLLIPWMDEGDECG